MMMAASRLSAAIRWCWPSLVRSRISPRRWKLIARLSAWWASPLLRPIWTRRWIAIGQPIEQEQGALDPADLAKRHGQPVLARIGGELAQDLAGDDCAGRHAGGKPQHVGPAFRDQSSVDPAADQRLE
jgi:hypothetical protein